MKRTFRLFLLVVVLLWTCLPVETGRAETHRDRPAKQQIQIPSAAQYVLVNLPIKSDTRVDLSSSATLPDIPQRGAIRFTRCHYRAREIACYVESHCIYTQITASYL